MDQNYKFEISVKAVVLNNDGKVLICQNEKGDWDLPGGRIRHGESIQECLAREIKEELGVECTLLDPAPLFIWPGMTDEGEPKFVVGFKADLESLIFKKSGENVKNKFFGKRDLAGLKLHNAIVNLKNWLKT